MMYRCGVIEAAEAAGSVCFCVNEAAEGSTSAASVQRCAAHHDHVRTPSPCDLVDAVNAGPAAVGTLQTLLTNPNPNLATFHDTVGFTPQTLRTTLRCAHTITLRRTINFTSHVCCVKTAAAANIGASPALQTLT